MAAAAISGSIGSGCGSPFFMVCIYEIKIESNQISNEIYSKREFIYFCQVKTQLQSKAAKEIAVGHQHDHTRMRDAFRTIFRQHGMFGIYQSAIPAMIRTTVGSCVQLTSFSQSGILFDKLGVSDVFRVF